MAYEPDFSGIWSKLDRAKQHRDALYGEIGFVETGLVNELGDPRYVNAYRIPMRLEYEPDTGYHLLRATAEPSDDEVRRWSLLIGDAVHNLRSALDHLVWQLALHKRDGREPRDPRSVQFPICDKAPPGVLPEDFAKDRMLKEVLPKHRAIIHANQPKGGRHHLGDFDPLIRLRELSNHDKHRMITPVIVMPNSFTVPDPIFERFGGKVVDWRILHRNYSGVARAKDDTELMRVKASPPSLQLNMEMAGDFSPDVRFHQVAPDDMESLPVIVGLDYMAARVAQIVREFEPLF